MRSLSLMQKKNQRRKRIPRSISKKDKSAVRKNPDLWKSVVAQVKSGSRGGKKGQWSARKAQLAVHIYKKHGGSYIGPKHRDNSLVRWTEQDWGYLDPADPLKKRSKRGRYLPLAVKEAMSEKQKVHSNARKREASRRGKQYAPYSTSTRELMRSLV